MTRDKTRLKPSVMTRDKTRLKPSVIIGIERQLLLRSNFTRRIEVYVYTNILYDLINLLVYRLFFRNRKNTLSHMRRSLNVRCHLFRSVYVWSLMHIIVLLTH